MKCGLRGQGCDEAHARHHLNLSIPTPTLRHKSISSSEKQWHYYSTICKVTKHTTSHTAYTTCRLCRSVFRIKLHATTLKLVYYS